MKTSDEAKGSATSSVSTIVFEADSTCSLIPAEQDAIDDLLAHCCWEDDGGAVGRGHLDGE
jgi:hypothetical protein